MLRGALGGRGQRRGGWIDEEVVEVGKDRKLEKGGCQAHLLGIFTSCPISISSAGRGLDIFTGSKGSVSGKAGAA